ncbi:MAG: ABC transporter substrate-binding protein [Chloroflexi bacterium]|nr:ABC transporter substrate-binding protein [Chloroflexota bacterium]
MPAAGGYWERRRWGRRSALRGAGLTAAGVAGAALIGCGGGKEEAPAARQAPAPASPGGAADGKVPADQVRVKPGQYEQRAPPTPAELAPLANGRYGGTLLVRYLDPPSMDFNRTLSCTINTTMDYTKNKLVRAVFGPKANPAIIDIEPDLAESWEPSKDASEFVFKLRKGVKFHNVAPVNGREFTAEDVKATILRYQGAGVQQDVWSPVVSMEIPDQYTVKFKLDQPFVDFPRNIAAWSHMDAKEVLEKPDLLREKAIGTGPFIQQEWTKKERSVFVKHPDYFEKGFPFLDKIITAVQDDANVWRAGFVTGNFFDWGARDDLDAADMLKSAKDVVYIKYTTAQGANTSGFHFQMRNPKWQDIRVRRAFSLGINRKEFDASRFNGDGGGYSKPPIAWQVLYDKLPTLESQGPWYQFDPKQASQLLQAAGYSKEKPLTADAPVWYQRAEYRELLVPEYQKILELKFNVRQVDNPTAVQMLNDRNYDDTMNVTWGPPSYSVDQVVFPWYFSKGGLNQNNVNDPEMDRLVTAQRREQNRDAQKELWRQIERRILDQVWNVFFPTSIFARGFFHNFMVNYRPHGIGGYTCYANAQSRSVWLDKGAPGTAVWPLLVTDASA